MFTFHRDLAQAHVLKLCPDQSYRHNAQKCCQQQDRSTSCGRFRTRTEKAGERDSDSTDLCEPAKNRKLKDACSATGDHE